MAIVRASHPNSGPAALTARLDTSVLRFVSRLLRCIHAAYACWRRRADVAAVGRILVVKLDAVGDIVLASAFFRELGRSFPQARITAILAPATASLMAHCPFLESIITFSPPSDTSPERRRISAYWFAMRHLWPRRFDLAFLPRWDVDYYLSTVLLCASGARKLAGWKRAFSGCGEGILNKAELRHAIVCSTAQSDHEADRNLQLVRAAGGTTSADKLEVWLHNDDRRAVERWLAARPVGELPLVGFGIGAADVRRRWPVECYARLANWIAAEGLGRAVLIGHGDLDRAAAQEIVLLCPDAAPVVAVGCFDLRQTCALLERCAAFVGNDSGPMHMAAAVGLPVVEISGLPTGADTDSPFSPARFGPWSVPARIVRPRANLGPSDIRADDPACLNIAAVPVAEVFGALQALLHEAGVGRSIALKAGTRCA